MTSEHSLIPVIAPISGVFYRKPAPEQPAYVEVGQSVKKGQTLCLLETMKVFTKLKAPMDGEVAEIIPEDGSTIGKRETLFRLKI